MRRNSMRRFFTVGLVSVFTALLALLAVGAALADAGHEGEEKPMTTPGTSPTMPDGAGMMPSPSIEARLPEELAVGREATLEAQLVDPAGAPISGAQVAFAMSVTFSGSDGEAELGQATTDAEGLARLAYTPRRDGHTDFIVKFEGDKRYASAKASREIDVLAGAPTYREEAGVRVPGINVWLLVSVLGAVWSTYLTVMAILVLIARKGRGLVPAPTTEGGSE